MFQETGFNEWVRPIGGHVELLEEPPREIQAGSDAEDEERAADPVLGSGGLRGDARRKSGDEDEEFEEEEKEFEEEDKEFEEEEGLDDEFDDDEFDDDELDDDLDEAEEDDEL